MSGSYNPDQANAAEAAASVLVKAYNAHITAHGPDGSTAAGNYPHHDMIVMGDADYGFIVRRNGADGVPYEFAVLVITPGPGQNALGIIGDQTARS